MGWKVTHQVLGPEVRFPARNGTRQADLAHPQAGTLFLAALGEVAVKPPQPPSYEKIIRVRQSA